MALEADVRRWVASLPSALRLPPNLGEGMSPFIDMNNNGAGNSMIIGPEHSVLQMQTCELAIMAQLLIVRIYTPFVRSASSQSTSNSNSNPNSYLYSITSHASAAASTAILSAAQNIMRASKILHVVLRSSGGTVMALPPMLDFFPLEKVVFDATVICAHAGLTAGTNSNSSNNNGNSSNSSNGDYAVLDDANLGLDLLFFMNRWGAGDGEVKRKIAESLKRRVTARAGGGQANGLKRKHDQLDLGGKDSLGTVGGSGMSVGQEPFAFEIPNYNNSNSSNNNINSNTTGLGPQPESINILPMLPMPVPQQEVMRPSGGTGEKDAKQAKKIPPVGIRIRSTKEADGVAARARAMSSDRERIQEAHGHSSSRMQDPPAQTHGRAMQAPRPLMTTVPRPLVPEFPHQYRSRSSSISMQTSEAQPPQQPPAPAPSTASIDYSMAFGEQMGRFSVVDIPSQQPLASQHQPQLSPTHPPFGASPTTFDPAQPTFEMSRAFEHRGSFDQARTAFDQPPRGTFDQHRGSFDQQSTHSGESSTFGSLSSPPLPPSTSISSANSPFGSTGGHPTTPTYTANVHHPSPPVFGQPNPSPTSYFNPPMTSSGGGYEGPFDNHSTNNCNSNMAPRMMSMDHGNAMMSSVPSTPMYEKHHFDLKPPDGVPHHAHHVPQTSYNDQNIQPHHSMAMGPPQQQQTATWTPPPQQPLITVQPGQQYWTTNEFKFYD